MLSKFEMMCRHDVLFVTQLVFLLEARSSAVTNIAKLYPHQKNESTRKKVI